ncbi:MAG: L,D-transpeptidase family protein [Acetivibrionales bacterium]|jgi:lipoprotein-anchoring transpeptidase ErfK/SrfK
MINLIIAIYIFCSLCSSTSGTIETGYAEHFTGTVSTYSRFVEYSSNEDCLSVHEEIYKAQQLYCIPAYEEAIVEPEITDYVEELKKFGYYKEEYKSADLNTRNAVLRFQSAHNIIVDGIWGEKSMSTLKKRLMEGNMRYNDIVTSPASDNKWIVINKTKRILTLYNGKCVIEKFPVAIGSPPSLTPDGKFSISVKVVNPAWGGGGYAKPVPGGSPNNPLGYRWMGLSIGGGDRYGVHGNNSPYSIGKNVSHGCIRMINSDVEHLYSIVPLNTKIWIGTEDQLEEWGITQEEY